MHAVTKQFIYHTTPIATVGRCLVHNLGAMVPVHAPMSTGTLNAQQSQHGVISVLHGTAHHGTAACITATIANSLRGKSRSKRSTAQPSLGWATCGCPGGWLKVASSAGDRVWTAAAAARDCGSTASTSASASASSILLTDSSVPYRRVRAVSARGREQMAESRSLSKRSASGPAPSRRVHTFAVQGGEQATEGVSSLKRKLGVVGDRLSAALTVFDLPAARAAVASLENDAAAGDTWEDATAAQALLTQLSTLRWVWRCGGWARVGGHSGRAGAADSAAHASHVCAHLFPTQFPCPGPRHSADTAAVEKFQNMSAPLPHTMSIPCPTPQR